MALTSENSLTSVTEQSSAPTPPTNNQTNSYYQGCGSYASAAKLDELEQSGLYVSEPKYDGIWCACVSDGIQQRLFSRNGLEKKLTLPTMPPGIWIGELGYGSQASTEKRKKVGHDWLDVFDAIQVDGISISDEDDNRRREILEEAWQSWSHEVQEHFPLTPRITSGFRQLYNSEDEGIILKQVRDRPHSPYLIGTKNPYWVKVKKTIEVDLVVMGYELSQATSFRNKGWAQNLLCGVYRNGSLVQLTAVGSLDHFLRQDIVQNWQTYKGRVVRVVAYKIFDSGSLRHPALAPTPFRDDKLPEECTWEALIKQRRSI